MKHRNPAALLGMLGAAGCLLAGCSARTEVSLSGNSPSQYSHVFITAQEVWFNTSTTAGPDDSGWQKFPLSTPATVDLVTDQGGTIGTIATNVNLLAGTYSQIRLIPVDPSAALTSSAQGAGAIFNAEADFVDGSGNTQQLPLELLNPDKGIGIQASLKVPIGASFGGTGIGGATSSTGALGTTDATSTAGIGTPNSTGTTSTATTTSTTTTGSTASTGTTTTTIASFTINLDGARDIVPFLYPHGATAASTATAAASSATGILLSSHATAYDLSEVGGIQGTLTLTNLPTGFTGLQVSAETLSADGTRHEIVLSTPVHSDGTFMVYPLPTSSSTPALYDLVIHGNGIATIIIKNVQLTVGTASAALSAATIPTSGSTTSGSTVTAPSLTTVSIGTLTPRAATAYTANITTAANASLPAGAQIGFYETLGAKGEVPYVIESSPIDPFNQVLFSAQALSSGTVDSGTYVASGETINLVSAAAVEGKGNYLAAARAANYADGQFSAKVTPAIAVPIAIPVPSLASGATSGSITAQITPATSGKYNQGQLLISHEGALVASVALDTVIAQGGTIAVTLPAGTATSVYYASVRVWNSSDLTKVSRQWYPGVIDLRSASSAATALTVN